MRFFILVLSFFTLFTSLAAQSFDRGTYLHFDGVDDFMDAPGGPGTGMDWSGASDWTVEMWLKPDSIMAGQTLNPFRKNHNFVGTLQVSFLLLSGSSFTAGLDNFTNGGWYYLPASRPLPMDTLTHIAVTKNGTELIIYFNGKLDTLGIIPQQQIAAGTSTSPFYVGGNGWDMDGYFQGFMDELRIWNYGRSQIEILENMHLTLTGNEVGLISYYPMNDSTGSPMAMDRAGNNHLELTNMDSTAAWYNSGVNVGTSPSSLSETIGSVPSGTSVQTFPNALAQLSFASHSGTEEFTVTYQEFDPNTLFGITAPQIHSNPMWTVSKSHKSHAFLLDTLFLFPNPIPGNLYPPTYHLYWRSGWSDTTWTYLTPAVSADTSKIGFPGVDRTGQFLIADMDLVGMKALGGTELVVYPNPAHEMVKIEVSPENLNDIMDFMILDAKGSLVYQAKINGPETMLNSRVLGPAGKYLLVFRNQKGLPVAQSSLLIY